jgi:excisionase family DNA binding protein
MNELELLTIPQLAALWHVSRRTIERRLESGEIPYVRVGPRRQIPAAAAARIAACDTRPGKKSDTP